MENKKEYRRFELIDKEKEQALLALIKQKGLSREDLILILSTLKLAYNRC